MPGCFVGYCTNSTAKGCKLFEIPKVPKRRQMWIDNMPSTEETPGKCAAFCEVCIL